MGLEGSITKNSEESFDKSNYLYGALFLIVMGVIGYSGYRLIQEISEYMAPYLDTNSYLPFQ